jgi:hypothetical protein
VSSPAALERHALLQAFTRGSRGDWRERLTELLDPAHTAALHIAVMREPFLQLILDRRKTIESRFSINRICPFEAVAAGDVLAFKAQSGPIVGLAVVEHAAFYELDPPTWRQLRRDFAGPLCADDDFWDQRAHARYATLLRVAYPHRIAAMPVAKTDRRGWVRLAGAPEQQALSL